MATFFEGRPGACSFHALRYLHGYSVQHMARTSVTLCHPFPVHSTHSKFPRHPPRGPRQEFQPKPKGPAEGPPIPRIYTRRADTFVAVKALSPN